MIITHNKGLSSWARRWVEVARHFHLHDSEDENMSLHPPHMLNIALHCFISRAHAYANVNADILIHSQLHIQQGDPWVETVPMCLLCVSYDELGIGTAWVMQKWSVIDRSSLMCSISIQIVLSASIATAPPHLPIVESETPIPFGTNILDWEQLHSWYGSANRPQARTETAAVGGLCRVIYNWVWQGYWWHQNCGWSH